MTTPQYEQLYKKLNPAQKKAVDTIEGPVMVAAGPGTGKTQVLTLRIANILLQTQINPENILALTFTESGVLTMRRRLVEIIGSPGYKVEIATFHSFCNEVIRRNPEDFADLISSVSVTEVEQIQIIEKIIQNASLELLKPFGDPLYHLKNVLSAINDLKKEGVTPDDLAQSIEEQKKDFDKIDDLIHEKGAYKGQMKGKYQDLEKDIKKSEELRVLYRDYQQQLKANKQYDFNDMLMYVVKALEKNQSLLMRLQERYQYILVDEHQDTNTAQNKLIELLSSFYQQPNLFVVGDDKQAIFRFQGASLENFLYFKKLYPTATLISLDDNYRSTQKILDAAQSLISKNAAAVDQQTKLKSNIKYPEELINIVKLSDYHAEYYFIADDIKQKIKNTDPREIAVLGRNNRDLINLAGVLEQKNIPYVIESDQNIFADIDIRKLILLAKAVANFGSDLELIELMHADFLQLNYLDLYKLIRLAKTSRKSVYEIIADKSLTKKAELEDSKTFVNLFSNLEKWSKLSRNERLENVLVALIQDSGLLDWIIKKPNSLDIIDKLSGLYEDVKIHTQKNPNFSLEDYLKYLDLLEAHDVLIKRSARTTLKNAVRLMTAHRSKGLEFDWVYIINAFDGHWGNMRRRSAGIKIPWEYLGVKLKLGVELDEIDDERRLFYVALTRAKKGVTISYSNRSLEGKEQVACQFLAEIEEDFKKEIEVEQFEKEFLEHKEILFAPQTLIKPDLKNIEFFKDLFFERGMSATALNNYLSCPWKFFYRNLLQVPDVKNKYMVFGSAIHDAISKYLRAARVSSPTEDYLINAFEYFLANDSLAGAEYDELLKKGQKVLPGYYKNRVAKWPKDIQTELFIGGINLTDDIKLTGKIDLIETIKKSGEVVVYDLKTGRTRRRSEMEDYKRQLIFYKLLLDRYHQGRMTMVRGTIDFIEPDPKGEYHQESFDMEVAEVKALEEQIVFIGNEIINLSFWDRRCDDKDCEYCRLRDLMLTGKSSSRLSDQEQTQLPLINDSGVV